MDKEAKDILEKIAGTLGFVVWWTFFTMIGACQLF